MPVAFVSLECARALEPHFGTKISFGTFSAAFKVLENEREGFGILTDGMMNGSNVVNHDFDDDVKGCRGLLGCDDQVEGGVESPPSISVASLFIRPIFPKSHFCSSFLASETSEREKGHKSENYT